MPGWEAVASFSFSPRVYDLTSVDFMVLNSVLFFNLLPLVVNLVQRGRRCFQQSLS